MNVTINGTELDSTDPRSISRAIRSARRAEKKAEEERQANRDAAQQKAESNAYRVLHRVATGERQRWGFETTSSRYGSCVLKEIERNDRHHIVRIDALHGHGVTIDLWGNYLIGIACDASGEVRAVFIQDCDQQRPVECHGFGVSGDQYAFADCPGVGPEVFPRDWE